MRTARQPCIETGSAVIEAKCSGIGERECLVVARGPEERGAPEAALALRQLAVQHPVRDTVPLPRVHQICARLRGLLLQLDGAHHMFIKDDDFRVQWMTWALHKLRALAGVEED